MKQQHIPELGEDVLKQAFRRNHQNNQKDELKLSQEEADQFEKAFEQKEFRDLMAEYVSEISDPKYRAEQEQYLRQLEEQNELPDGKDIIRPQPGFVLKFKYSKRCSNSKNKSKDKLFINVVHSKQVIQPTYASVSSKDKHGKPGRNWCIPYTFGPMRMENDNKKSLVPTFDCCFHPLALVYASKSVPYRDLIAATVREGATKQFKAMNDESVDIDRHYLVLKGTQYKNGQPPAMMIETTKEEKSTSSKSSNGLKRNGKIEKDGVSEVVKAIKKKDLDKVGTSMKKGFLLKETQTRRKMKGNKEGRNITTPNNNNGGFGRGGGTTEDGNTIPNYEIIERGEFDMTDNNIQGLNRPSTRPKFLIIRVKLPGIKSVKHIELDVSEERLTLKSLHSNPIYNLCIKLPYPIMSDDGSAKFDKKTCILAIHIPVCRPDVLNPWSEKCDDGGKHDNAEDRNDNIIDNSDTCITNNSNDQPEEEDSVTSSPVLVEKQEPRNDLNESPVIIEKPYHHSRWLDTVKNNGESRNLREEFARDGAVPTLVQPSQATSEQKENNTEFRAGAESFSVSINDEQSDEESNYDFQVVEHITCNGQNDDDNKKDIGEQLNQSDPSPQQLICKGNIIFELD